MHCSRTWPPCFVPAGDLESRTGHYRTKEPKGQEEGAESQINTEQHKGRTEGTSEGICNDARLIGHPTKLQRMSRIHDVHYMATLDREPGDLIQIDGFAVADEGVSATCRPSLRTLGRLRKKYQPCACSPNRPLLLNDKYFKSIE
jgi:hypothetical protein